MSQILCVFSHKNRPMIFLNAVKTLKSFLKAFQQLFKPPGGGGLAQRLQNLVWLEKDAAEPPSLMSASKNDLPGIPAETLMSFNLSETHN